MIDAPICIFDSSAFFFVSLSLFRCAGHYCNYVAVIHIHIYWRCRLGSHITQFTHNKVMNLNVCLLEYAHTIWISSSLRVAVVMVVVVIDAATVTFISNVCTCFISRWQPRNEAWDCCRWSDTKWLFYGLFFLARFYFFVNSSFVFSLVFGLSTTKSFVRSFVRLLSAASMPLADVGQRMHVVVTSSHINVSFVYKWNGVVQIRFIITLLVRRKRPYS